MSEPSVNFAGLDATTLNGFPDVISTVSREELDAGSLAPDEAIMNESAADELATEAGDQVQVFVQNQPHEFTIVFGRCSADDTSPPARDWQGRAAAPVPLAWSPPSSPP